tara:strand:+ start:1746 stop:2006 length:261 start_codon:yes stop_codon:yes gene_type:complete
MKVFRFEMNTKSTHWETCDVFVEAETKEEAKKLFNKDPDAYTWDNWDTVDSEIHEWEIDDVEFDDYMTNYYKKNGIGSFANESQNE